MRLIPTAAVLLLGAVALSACVATPPAPTPSSPAPSATPRAAVVASSPAALRDPASVPALRVVSYGRSASAPMQGSWAYVDGDAAFNQAVDTAVLSVLDPLAGGTFQPSLGAAAVHAIAQTDSAAAGPRISASVVDAAGPLLGMRLSVADASGTRVLTTIYTDTGVGQALTGTGLVADGAASRVMDVVRRARGAGTSVAQATGASATPDPAADAAALRDASIGPAGQLIVPADATGGTVVIDAGMATPLLSPFGLQLQGAVHAGTAPAAATAVGPGLVHVPCSIVACVALTYDDGPDPTTTPELLGILHAQGIPATFFEIGQHVAAAPTASQQVAQAGDVLGNHTWDHPNLTTLTPDQVQGEVAQTDAAFQAAGLPAPRIMRAPYGATNAAVLAAAGRPFFDWSVDSFDWQSKNPKTFVPLVLRKIRPGGVVLMHDIYQTTVDGQTPLITGLKADGYTFVTIPQLFEGIPLRDGQVYGCRGTYTPDTAIPCSGR